jgi:hypothetical protein
MAKETQPPASFSPGRKWTIGFHVGFIIFVVLAVTGMVNYLSHDYFARFHLSTRNKIELSPRTIHFLKGMTNQVKAILYYDKNDPLYSTIAELLNEYRFINRRISIQTVDYLRDTGNAQKIKAQYELASAADKNLVIFDCQGKKQIMHGNLLSKYVLEQVPNEKEREFRRKPTEFMGEMWFTAALLHVTNPKPFKAYFLTGHDEGQIDSGDEQTGYLKFASVLRQNYIQPENLSLLGTNTIPMDCNLLVIAGPATEIPELELKKIEQYLNQGGRMLVLFNFVPVSKGRETGLEKLLAKWGVDVGMNVIKDPERTLAGSDLIVENFGKHGIVNPLLQSRLHLVLPRSVGVVKNRLQTAEAPKVDELAFSGPKSFALGDPSKTQAFPLMVAVEKGAIPGVIAERGTTRMVIAGDSIFLANHQISSAANLDFGNYALNWLLDRTQLMDGGIGPRPVTEYKILMTRKQLQAAQWVLLAAMPGLVIAFGTLVWMKRRR